MKKQNLYEAFLSAFALFIILLGVHSPSALAQQSLDIYVSPQSVGQPWGRAEGLLQFRGNPTRTWYGDGTLANNYQVGWRYPDRSALCAISDKKQWCGSGWTGQPAIWRRPDGRLEVVVGTYDRGVHFIDFETGRPLRKPFRTGDIIKGSVTLDPDGFPLLYFGSRDNKYRIVSLQGAEAEELWSLDAKDGVPYTIWNNDWDGNASVVNDHLIFGGENGWFYTWKINRQVVGGKVKVRPEIRARMPGWNPDLLKKTGDRNASIESSVAIYESIVYLANSAGRVLGLNLKNVKDLTPEIVFDFWVGDDVDASPVVDEDGMLYIAAEYERFLPRARDVGQLIKFNPYDSQNPLVWKVDVREGNRKVGGLWATPALGKDVIYAATHAGDLLTVDQNSGEVLSRLDVGFHAWSSPVVIGDRLLVGTCSPGGFKIYDIGNPRSPRELSHYRLQSEGCIESTPAVWQGQIVVGSRDGHIYKFVAQ